MKGTATKFDLMIRHDEEGFHSGSWHSCPTYLVVYANSHHLTYCYQVWNHNNSLQGEDFTGETTTQIQGPQGFTDRPPEQSTDTLLDKYTSYWCIYYTQLILHPQLTKKTLKEYSKSRKQTGDHLNLGLSLLTAPTSISAALKSAVSTDDRHMIASCKYSNAQQCQPT